MGTDGGWGINLQDFSRIFPGKKVTFVKTWISKSFLDFRKKIRGMTSPGFWWGSTSHVIFVVDVCFFWVIFYALLIFVASLLVVDSESETCPRFSKARRLGGGAHDNQSWTLAVVCCLGLQQFFTIKVPVITMWFRPMASLTSQPKWWVTKKDDSRFPEFSNAATFGCRLSLQP